MRRNLIVMLVVWMFVLHATAQTSGSTSPHSERVNLTPADITAYTKAMVTVRVASSNNEELSFDVQSSPVNQAIIAAYISNPTIWSNQNLFIVGVCCAKEHRFAEAKAVFSRLTNEAPESIGAKRAYGNAAFLNGDYNEARKVYTSLWTNIHDIAALKGLGALGVQERKLADLRALIPDLIQHKADDLDFRKVLLLYSLMEDNIDRGGSAYAAAVKGLKKSDVEENTDFRKVLLMATMKYKEAAEQAAAPNGANRAIGAP